MLADENASQWKYSEKVDPITTQTVRTAMATVGDPDTPNLIADVAFSCSPPAGADYTLAGGPPYFTITTYARPDATGKADGVALAPSSSIEFRFNGEPLPVSLDDIEHWGPVEYRGVVQTFANSATVSLRFFSEDGISDESNPLFIQDPRFVVRVNTTGGEFTYSTSLRVPAIAKVLTSCGVRFEKTPIHRVAPPHVDSAINGTEQENGAGAAAQATAVENTDASQAHPAKLDPDSSPPLDDYYPDAARRRGEQGTTTVDFCVGPDGRTAGVPSVQKSSGSPRLDDAAVQWISHARFVPATDKHGMPVKSCASTTLNFTLSN